MLVLLLQWSVYVFLLSILFFFKQKTAYEMRISDWSSDVCSSDLPYEGAYGGGETEQRAADACSWAAEGELGDGARVESITGTRPDQGYGWYVAGTVAKPGEPRRSFGCTYQNGRATDVRVN